jgi:hypothetical protein
MYKISEKNKNKFIKNIYPKKCKKYGFKYIPSVLPKVNRLIVLGDIHGDYKLFIHMLQIANLIDMNKTTEQIIWIGGNTVVVQVGDQIDRCRPMGNATCAHPDMTYDDEASDIKILELANNLHLQASNFGGGFISLLGNHELMNVVGNLSYVSYEGIKEFENYKDPKTGKTFENGHEARVHAFKPGNEYANLLGCTRLPAIIIGKHLMVHAGIVNGLIKELNMENFEDLESVNISIRKWLLKLLEKKHINNIIDANQTSMFWTRILGNIPPNVSYKNPDCVNHINKVLKIFKIGSMIIGHTPQSFSYSDDINQTCSGKIWRVDNGSSSAFSKFDRELMTTGKVRHSRRPQVLEIIDDEKYFILDGVYRKELHVDQMYKNENI